MINCERGAICKGIVAHFLQMNANDDMELIGHLHNGIGGDIWMGNSIIEIKSSFI